MLVVVLTLMNIPCDSETPAQVVDSAAAGSPQLMQILSGPALPGRQLLMLEATW